MTLRLEKRLLMKIQQAFMLQAEGLILGGVDALLIETSQDILEVKLAIEACHMAMEKVAKKVSIIANVTLDQYGKMLPWNHHSRSLHHCEQHEHRCIRAQLFHRPT